MHIRDLKWNKLRMWPPEFGLANQVVGEKGILVGVWICHDLKVKVIIVTANYLDEERKGIIILEDPIHLEILFEKLEKNIGKPLKEIGDLEIDINLPLQKMDQKQVRPRTMQKSQSIRHRNLKSKK
jgi:hypothetical protein